MGIVLMTGALLVGTACGKSTPSGGPTPGSSSPSPTTSATPTIRPATSVSPKPGGSTGTPKPGKTGKPTPAATAPGGSTGRIDVTCARRGVDTQGLTVKTQAKGPVGFNTMYSDGSYRGDGKHDYQGGSTPADNGFADDAGNYRTSWVVPANAPTGLATIEIATAEGGLRLTFNVVAKDGHCG
jgi:hypothetical protein